MSPPLVGGWAGECRRPDPPPKAPVGALAGGGRALLVDKKRPAILGMVGLKWVGRLPYFFSFFFFGSSGSTGFHSLYLGVGLR